jgi:hypothetical protein
LLQQTGTLKKKLKPAVSGNVNIIINKHYCLITANIPEYFISPFFLSILTKTIFPMLDNKLNMTITGRYQNLINYLTDYVYTVIIKNGAAVETFHGPGCVSVTGYTSEDYQEDPDLWYRMVHG